MRYLPFILFGVIFVIFGVSIVIAWLLERKRRGDLANLAVQLGLEFTLRGSAGVPGLNGLQLFKRGRNRAAYNIMKGSVEGVRVAVFDYRFVTGSGKSTTTHKQTVCAIFDERLDLPVFEMRPEGFWQKLGALFGYQDIDFPENEVFSKKYVLRGQDEERIRATFTPDVLGFFETRPGLYVEGAGDTIIFFKAGRRMKVGAIQDFLLDGIRGLVIFTSRP